MAGGLSAFFAQNALRPETVGVSPSNRFVDEDGNPMRWEIHPVTAEADEALRRKYTKLAQVTGKPGQMRQDFDANGYLSALAAQCTSFPNLNDQALQDSYGVMGAESLLKAMLLPGEYQGYLLDVQKVCGFEAMEDKVEKAKN